MGVTGRGLTKHLLLAALAGIFFGSIGFFALNIPDLSGIEITFFRFFLGALFLLSFTLLFKERIQIKDKKILVLAGLLNGLAALLFIVAIKNGAKLGDAAFLIDTGYIFSAVFSWIFLREKIKGHELIAIIAATIGAMFILKPFTILQNTANVIALTAGLGMALQSVAFRKSIKIQNSITTSLFSFIFSTFWLFPFILPGFQIPTLGDVPYLFGIALFGTALPLYLIITSLRKLKTFEAGVPALLEPLSAATLGFIAFGQVLDVFSVIGGALILVAILYSALKK